VSFLYAETGQRPELGRAGTGTRINNSSIVFRIQYGTQSMLFVGDLEGKERGDPPSEVKYGERLLLDSVDSTALRSTVLKVAHHGSETSSTTRFIEAVDPHYVVVSSGRRDFDRTPNFRFLPDRSTLQRYCDHADSIRIYRTDQDDEGERKTEKTDADGDHITITMTAKETRIQPYSGGNPITPDGLRSLVEAPSRRTAIWPASLWSTPSQEWSWTSTTSPLAECSPGARRLPSWARPEPSSFLAARVPAPVPARDLEPQGLRIRAWFARR
jgi:hypothetical protein